MKNLLHLIHCAYTPFILTSLLVIACFTKTAAQSQKPNIILILGDDIGYQTLTCNGGTTYSTPNLDSLAQHGMRFTQCHASPLCSPSRFMLLTGKYNFRNYTVWGKMERSQKTIANIMKDAGYKTACYGKWQFDGADTSAHAFGFDKYCLWNPFQSESEPRYKNPRIYTNGAYLSDQETANKYSEDIFGDSILNFIESNQSTPFFIYYPMVLAHYPFSPTPDDPDFSTWSDSNAINGVSDTSYYHSMITYMDKKIGQIVEKLKSLGIENNTVIIYTGDNGTPGKVSEPIANDSLAMGQKGKTNELGTHVPLIAYWPGTINAGTINNDLVDFTDFLPTMAGIANIPVPTNYGPLDGISFSPRLTDQPGTPRNWIFCHYDPHPPNNKYRRWVQNATHKLYDTSFYSNQRLFYNIANDPKEANSIPDTLLTPDETLIKQQFLDVINGYIEQGIPILSGAEMSAITDSSAVALATIEINAGSTVSTSGVVWSINPNPTVSSGSYTSGTAQIGLYKSVIQGLISNTTYHVRAFAANAANIGYGDEITFTTHLGAPHAIPATPVDSISLIAHWNSLPSAASYRLDVSTMQAFSTSKVLILNEGFNNGTTPPKGWKISSGIITSTKRYGLAAPSLQFTRTGQQVTTKILPGTATKLKFWLRGAVANAGSLLVEGYNGITWKVIDSIANIPNLKGVTLSYDATTTPPLADDLTQFRFTYTKTNGNLFFDDVSINYKQITPSFVTGYNDLVVNDTSQHVTGLIPNSNYYYRVRAVDDNGSSPNSNVINAIPCTPPLISSVTAVNLTCPGAYTGMIHLSATGNEPLLYSWTGPGGFTSSDPDISNLAAGTYEVTITSNEGCSIDTSILITEPSALMVSSNADSILCNGGTTTLTITASGGTGNYHYTLRDAANNATGPQDQNYFTVAAGNYNVTVTDDNGCSFTTDAVQVDEPPALSATANAELIICGGGTTTLTVIATGGTENYHYTLFDGTNITGPQDENHFIVSAGNYTVTITDDNGCSFTTEAIQVTEPQALAATATAEPIICSGGTTTLTVTATGGTGNYHYTLSDGTGPQDDNHFTVVAGNYTVTVTDDKVCSFTTDGVQVDEPLALTASANADPIVCIGGATTLTASPQGGTGSYHYTLSDAANNTVGPQDENYFTVAAGSYTVTITDGNGCSFTTESVQVDDGTDPCGEIASTNNNKRQSGDLKAVKNNQQLSILVYPNPASIEFTLYIQSRSNANAEIIITDIYGRKVYQAGGSSYNKYSFGKEFSSGTYFLKVMQGKNIRTLKIIKGR